MKILPIAGLCIAGLLAAVLAHQHNPSGSAKPMPIAFDCPDFSRSRITVGANSMSIGIAATAQEQRRGLSDCREVPVGLGLLFPYQPPQPAVFWMKDMLIPIDIIWIADGQVVGVEHNVPPPVPGTPNKTLVRYPAPEPVSAVLEVAAGTAVEQGIEVGTHVTGLPPAAAIK
ncbi:MAG: hypothetical protein COT71_03765 [Candidatus Andersenbacteria bacterium CG10_big_fil_rev_8_21_14_0_10_54_11]|uniref:DUF192 domain-containing protein n=1 Tax=Candidatus Andersenbacteria bacterium CG10_big_fil_rev_8_21_14_0_10_54_11 TaxID=1974485 RepID=A0A2M6WYJ4_9BACT|nr:MAG: hypothetical protein COT71_03765 [Candidatus Andersenbacteria bacterium CG10_big_fil_rev_8_21_14_0_10_54_11]